jgi:hypothetical protein
VNMQPKIAVELGTHYVNNGQIFVESVLRSPGTADTTTIPFHRLIIDGTDLTNVKRRGQDYAVFVQDAWRPATRLTINAGLRVDHVVWTDELFDVTSQTSTELGPRFGVNYLVTSDGKSVARAHWVRVHDVPTRMTTGVGTATLTQRDLYDLDLNGTFETTFVTPATVALTPNRTIDPDLHQPFIDEWGAGFTRQFRGNTTVGVAFVDRHYLDRPTYVETNGRYNGNVFIGYADESVNEIYKITNNSYNWPVYRSLEFSATKRTARVQGIASYVRQFRNIAGTWQPNDPASFIQPAAFANDAGIGSPVGSTGAPTDANSLSGTNMTQRSTASAQWQDHVVRLGVTWTAPWDFIVATNYTFESGAWSGPIITRIDAPDPAFGPATVTLSNGRRVSNPLATTLRFAYPTRGDGQLTTPDLHAWNIRIGRRFSWRSVKFDAALDVFNVTNNGADASFQSGANQTFNPLFGTTTFRQLPRSAQLVVRTWF